MIESKIITIVQQKPKEKVFSRFIRGKNTGNIYIVNNNNTGILIYRGCETQSSFDYIGNIYHNIDVDLDKNLYEPFYGIVELSSKQ